jgi:hypothetical protein
VKLEGTLDAFSLPDIFSLLSMTKKTGGLHLQRSGSHGAVWFADGMLTGGASDLSRQSLGRRIAGSGRVTDEALTAAVTQVRLDPDAGVASVLRDADAVDEGDLHSLVTEQIMDAVFDLMRWNDGSFAFVVDEPNRDGVGVSCRVDDVVAEVRRRLDQWSTIDAAVADQDTVLTITCEPPAEPQLSVDEWSILALVDGQRSVGEIVDVCGRGEYAVVVTLADLVARKLLETEDGGVAALTRRQDLFGAIEAVSSPAPVAVPVQSAQPVMAPPPPPPAAFPAEPIPASYAAPVPPAPTYEPAPMQYVAEAPPAQRPVVPHRDPGPFTTVPQPEQVDPIAAASSGAPAGGASGIIERDPSVNKSLLLRLIAGVRGL